MRLAKRIGNDLGWAVMRLSETLVRLRGTGYAIALGRSVGRLMWAVRGVLFRRWSGRAFGNAGIVLAGRPARARRRVLKRAFADNVAYWPELANYVHRGAQGILRAVRVEGREHLDAALARGRGVIAPSIHLGNFPLIGIWMAQSGYDFHYLSRFPHDERVQARLAFVRRRTGITVIRDHPRRKCAVDCLAALRRNEIIFFQIDHPAMHSKAGVFVDFFGRPFHAFGGAMSLAMKTGAAIVPMYIVRTRGIHHRLVIEPEFPFERTGDKLADTKANLGRLMRRFEGWILKHPEQWWWTGRRWRQGRAGGGTAPVERTERQDAGGPETAPGREAPAV